MASLVAAGRVLSCSTQHGLRATVTPPKNLTPGPHKGWVASVSFHQDTQVEALCPGTQQGDGRGESRLDLEPRRARLG